MGSGTWKLIGNPRDTSNRAPLHASDQLFLVDLADDPGETKNMASEYPNVTRRLQELHVQWLQDVVKQ